MLDTLNRLLSPHDLEYGPRPATHSHCTLGGMIGNNSCGATAQRTGKVVDNVERLEMLLYDGTRMWVGPTSDADYEAIVEGAAARLRSTAQLNKLRDDYADEIRAPLPEDPAAGLGLQHRRRCCPSSASTSPALVGSEGTLVTVLHAELRLVPVVPARTAVLLGYPDVAASADAVPTVLATGRLRWKGIDGRLVAFQRPKGMHPAGP